MALSLDEKDPGFPSVLNGGAYRTFEPEVQAESAVIFLPLKSRYMTLEDPDRLCRVKTSWEALKPLNSDDCRGSSACLTAWDSFGICGASSI